MAEGREGSRFQSLLILYINIADVTRIPAIALVKVNSLQIVDASGWKSRIV